MTSIPTAVIIAAGILGLGSFVHDLALNRRRIGDALRGRSMR